MHSSSLSSLSENKNFCPSCFEPINLKKYLPNNIKETEFELSEFMKLTCEKCFLEFSFLYCEICNSKIFMKIHPNSELFKFNGLNGYNIQCPYKSCQSIFYFTICSKCKKAQKIKNYVKEGNKIICKYCNFQYIQVHTPIKYCTDISYMEKSKLNSSFPSGIMISYNNKKIYQKINCYYCFRPIVYSSDIKNKNQYIECQRVECPYNDCKKLFNRIICPNCNNEIYINDAFYEMGSLIKCNSCGNHFGKIFCPNCQKLNTCHNKFSLGFIQCGFSNCKKESNMINCLFCKQLNILDLNIFINGKTIKCGYCKNIFNKVLCPFCKQINPFPFGDFSFGKIYKCQYLTCMKYFQFFICPKCNHYSYNKQSNELVEGQKMKCSKCQIKFMNLACQFCKINIIIYNSSFKIGQLIRCPNEKCNKIFSFISCSKCQKLIFSQENENLSGENVKCSYENCSNYTISIVCPLCKVNIVYNNERTSFKEGDSIFCGKCKNNYRFRKYNEVCCSDITYLKEIEGKSIDFGIGEVDENYLSIQDLFFGYNKIDNSSMISSFNSYSKNSSINSIFNDNISRNIPYKDCIICHNNIKESVFYPCGHRCTCYNCAVVVFAVNKKCPKCQKEIVCIIRRVYE